MRHFDLTAQAVAKLERGHARDLADVDAMLDRDLISPAGSSRSDAIEPELYRFPAIDPRPSGEPWKRRSAAPPAPDAVPDPPKGHPPLSGDGRRPRYVRR